MKLRYGAVALCCAALALSGCSSDSSSAGSASVTPTTQPSATSTSTPSHSALSTPASTPSTGSSPATGNTTLADGTTAPGAVLSMSDPLVVNYTNGTGHKAKLQIKIVSAKPGTKNGQAVTWITYEITALEDAGVGGDDVESTALRYFDKNDGILFGSISSKDPNCPWKSRPTPFTKGTSYQSCNIVGGEVAKVAFTGGQQNPDFNGSPVTWKLS